MTDTAQHTVITALVDLWDGALDVPVYDGPNAVEKADFAGLWVGYDPTDDNAQAVEVAQSHPHVGGRSKDEEGTITCAIGAWSGDTDTKPRRERVAEILSKAEAAVRATLDHPEQVFAGLVVTDLNFGERMTLHQQLTSDGNEVLALFTVRYRARI